MLSKITTATALYRISAIILFLFAIAHTLGFLHFVAPTAEGRDVFAKMTTVQFEVDGSVFSYGRFYEGFGLFITASQLFLAYLSLVMSRLARNPGVFPVGLGWAFAAVQFSGMVISLQYISLPPAILSLVLTALLAVAVVRVTRARSMGPLAGSAQTF